MIGSKVAIVEMSFKNMIRDSQWHI